MAVYDEADDRKSIAFYSSPDLKTWTYESRIDGFYECPDLFELKTADGSERRWVLYAADGEYMLGDFDGKEFKSSSGKHKLWHGNFYAAQTFDHAPLGRRVQIGWGRGIEFPGMPFNQQMTAPVDLALTATADGTRMTAAPVPELGTLRGRKQVRHDVGLTAEDRPVADVAGDSFDIAAEIDPGSAESVTLTVRGVPVRYDGERHALTCRDVTAPVETANGVVSLRLLADRGSVEVFANGGRIAMSVAALQTEGAPPLTASAMGGAAKLRDLVVYEMKSAWRE
jgi:fructan beta-fructosidase